MSTDIQVAGPGSPVSIRKFLAGQDKDAKAKPFMILVDGTHSGIAHDDPEVMYITPEERKAQALHYVTKVFNGTQISAYLYRYLHYMYVDEHKFVYKSDQDLFNQMQSGKLTPEDEEWGVIMNIVKWAEHNEQALQIIGDTIDRRVRLVNMFAQCDPDDVKNRVRLSTEIRQCDNLVSRQLAKISTDLPAPESRRRRFVFLPEHDRSEIDTDLAGSWRPVI